MATRKHYHADDPTHDLWLHDDAGQWLVEERVGGPAANSRFRSFTSQGLAETFARSVMNKSSGTTWHELPVGETTPSSRATR
jgi:hypothetical protein